MNAQITQSNLRPQAQYAVALKTQNGRIATTQGLNLYDEDYFVSLQRLDFDLGISADQSPTLTSARCGLESVD